MTDKVILHIMMALAFILTFALIYPEFGAWLRNLVIQIGHHL